MYVSNIRSSVLFATVGGDFVPDLFRRFRRKFSSQRGDKPVIVGQIYWAKGNFRNSFVLSMRAFVRKLDLSPFLKHKELAALNDTSPDAALDSPETMDRLNSLYEKIRDFDLPQLNLPARCK